MLSSRCGSVPQIAWHDGKAFRSQVCVTFQIDRGALPPALWHLKAPRQYQPPQSRLEMEVQLIWQAVLNKREMISCDADFSEVGGNMMHAVIANGIVRLALWTPSMPLGPLPSISRVPVSCCQCKLWEPQGYVAKL